MCKYKEVKAGKSSRYVSSKGYLQDMRARDVRRSHEDVMGCFFIFFHQGTSMRKWLAIFSGCRSV
jgi:hypothetical protein